LAVGIPASECLARLLTEAVQFLILPARSRNRDAPARLYAGEVGLNSRAPTS